MKKIRTLILAAILALFVGTPKAHAQVPTVDPVLIAQETIAWIDEIFSASEQLAALGEQFAVVKEQLDQAKKIYEKVTPFIQEGREIYQIYRAIDRAVDDFTMMENYVTACAQSGRMSAAKARSIRMQMTRFVNEVKEIENSVKEYLKTSNLLPPEARIKLILASLTEIDDISDEIETLYIDEMADIYNDNLNASAALILDNALGNGYDEQKEKAAQQRAQDIIDKTKLALDSETKKDPQYDGPNKAVVDNVFNFTTVIIAVVATLLLVWAFARRTKDPQHADALWKVFAGLIFVLLLLQLIKVMVFDSGFFSMTVPNF